MVEGQHRLTRSMHPVCFSPDSKFLVAGAEDKTIKLWDIQVELVVIAGMAC